LCWLTFTEEFDYEVVHWKRRRHASAGGFSRTMLRKPNEDIKPKRVGDDSGKSDAEKSETEEAVMNVRPVNAHVVENIGME